MREAFESRARERLRDVEPLPSPEALRRSVQAPARTAAIVQQGRRALRDLLHGEDDRRLAVIIGPRSLHDPALALEYASRLRQLAQSLAGDLVILMRTHVENPISGSDWRGLVHDPDGDGSGNVARGLRMARVLLRDVNALGVPCAAELVDPLVPGYLGDLMAWGGLGPGLVGSPVHVQLASGMEFPVGFHEAENGALDAACHSLRDATRPKRFPGLAQDGQFAVLESSGNPDLHLVVGGATCGSDFGAKEVERAAAYAAEFGLARPLMLDCSREQAGEPPRTQAQVCRGALQKLREGRRDIAGLMLESELEEQQRAVQHRPLTETGTACMGWNESADLICEIAEAVKLAT